MYDFAEIRSATDAFWQALRDALITRGITDVPQTIVRPKDLPEFWSNPSLLLGQTCGYPLMFGLCGDARYVATPHYKTRYSEGAYHKSLIIVRDDAPIHTLQDARNMICAINMADSNTGMNLLRLEIAKLRTQAPFFKRVYETLAHRKSLVAVAEGQADIAAIDCVTFTHIEKIEPDLIQHIKILAETEETPNLPFITSGKTDEGTLAALRDALNTVATAPEYRAIQSALMLDGISILANDAYERVRNIENQAVSLGYPVLM